MLLRAAAAPARACAPLLTPPPKPTNQPPTTKKKVYGVLDALLSTREYLVGGALSVSDVAVGAYLLYVPVIFPDLDLSARPHVTAYMARLAARPACAATVGAPHK